jgi:hypothetical protein
MADDLRRIQRYLLNQIDFQNQLDLCNDLRLRYFDVEARRNPASRILVYSEGVNFSLRGGDGISPYFAIAYAYFNLLRRCMRNTPRGSEARLTEFMLYLGMRRPDEEAPNYNRLQNRAAGNTRLNDLLKSDLPMNKFFLTFISPWVAELLAEEHYSGVDISSYNELISGAGVIGRNTVVQFALEATAFFVSPRRQEATTAAERAAAMQDITVRQNRRRSFYPQGATTRTRAGNMGGGGKRKMFYHNNDVHFHHEVEETMDCIHLNPLTDGEYCFPMAFLVSQVREHTYTETTCVERISQPLVLQNIHKSIDSYPYMILPYDEVEKIPEFARGKNFFVFNPIKPESVDHWEKAGSYLHSCVEKQLDRDIDYTSWRECPQAYADAFGVVIHIFIKNEKGRFDVYIPEKKPVIVRHIYMYCEDDHFNPVIDIRKFTNARCDRLLSWCDYCQKSIHHTALVAKKTEHILKCYDRWSFVSESCCEFLNMTEKEQKTSIRKGNETKEFCRSHNKFECSCDDFTHGNKVSEHNYFCNVCGEEGSYNTFAFKHRCYFKKPEAKDPIANEKLFVLDIESLQEPTITGSKFVHELVLMCVRNVYDDNTRKEYKTMEAFVDECMNETTYQNATFIAHNGGGYDYQFVLKCLEKRGLEYEFVPRPGSDHKYISLTIIGGDFTIKFIDFMCLIPGSLKGIAQSFQLEIQKGDFPHRFLTKNTLNYIGPFPPIDTEDDFFSLQWKKNDKDVEDVKEWHALKCTEFCCCVGEHVCMKPQWNCFSFLTEYCWLDVDVLAKACQKYRDLLMNAANTGGEWNPTPIDPFQYLTQSQLAMQIFLSGFGDLPPIGITIPRPPSLNQKQFVWYHRLQELHPDMTFIHYGTNPTRYMWLRENVYIDCYCVETATVYLFFNTEERSLPETEEKIERWMEYEKRKFIGGVEVMYEDNLRDISEYELNVANLSGDRDFFFGGRTEVFSPYAKPSDQEEIKYLDVCSLYPTICSFSMVPTGHPILYFGSQCDMTRLDKACSDPYFGYVRCKVIPNKKDTLGLLPSKMASGKLVFNLLDKIGMWFTEEIYLAMQNGYQVVELYEVHHFDSDNRSDSLMRGYMESFLTLKQEAEGWKKLGASSDTPNDEEQDRILEQLFESNGGIGRVRKENVKKNPVLRQVSKIFLNCLWGKFCQRRKADFFSELTSYKDYEALMSTKASNQMSFRQMSPGRWRVKYTKPDHMLPANPRYNIYLAAAVTAQARCYLHRQMLHVGPSRILYCDTDSIVFLYPKDRPSLTGIGLGKWTDEHPGEVISDFMAIAPKCYMLNIEGDSVMKAKGCIMSVQNRSTLSHEAVKKLIHTYCIQKQLETVELQNFSIFTNSTDINFSYATMFSRYNTKQVRCILNKRQLITEFQPDDILGDTIARVSLLPEGFEI